MVGRLRPIPVGMTLLLIVLTLGIYFHVRSFKCSGDLHRMPDGWHSWKAFFWLSFVPLAGVAFQLTLYFKNNKQANQLGMAYGRQPSYLPFILACIPLVNIAAPFVWASRYNELAAQT